VVVPHGSDQFWWASILHQAGVAPEPLPFGQIQADGLAEGIAASLSPDAKAKAEDLGRRLRQEDGASTAVKLIEEVHDFPERAAAGFLSLC
jgi:UDP:flavonoid glycosyltransferase YjiC (YdhE family)